MSDILLLNSLAEAKAMKSICAEQHILPVRYALSSEASTPIDGTPLHCSLLPKLKSYRFTLRTIYSGYIFLTWDGAPDIFAYTATLKGFTPLMEKCPPGGPTIRIPRDKKQFYIRYVRIPSGKEDQTGQDLWKLVAENLKKHKSDLMQQVTLEEGRYDALVDEFSKYVEEFRKKPGYLAYLPCWKENQSILHVPDKEMPSDQESPHRWYASCEHLAHREAKNQFCEDARFVALHDCVGNLLDCASIHAKSAATIAYFQRWHSPLVTTSILIDEVIAAMKNREQGEWDQDIKEKYADFVKDAEEDKYLRKIYNNPAPSTRDPDKSIAEYKASHPSPETMETTSLLRKQSRFIDINFKDRDAYLNEQKKNRENLRDSAKVLIDDWIALLKYDDKNYSFVPTMTKVFESDDQKKPPNTDKLADPLTLARGRIFTLCHTGISDLEIYLPGLDDLFTKESAYIQLWKDVIGKGGVPQQEFGGWLLILAPFVGYRVHQNDLKDSVLKNILQYSCKRMGVPSPLDTPSPKEEDSKEGVDIGCVMADIFALSSSAWGVPHESVFQDLAKKTGERIFGDALPIITKKYVEVLSEGKQEAVAVRDYIQRLQQVRRIVPLKRNPHTGGVVMSWKGEEWATAKSARAPEEEMRAKLRQIDEQAAHAEAAYTGKLPKAKALSQGVAVIALVISVADVADLTKRLTSRSKKEGVTGAALGLAKLIPSAMGLVQSVRAVFLREAIGGLFGTIVAAAPTVDALVEIFDLYRRSDNAAIAGQVIMGISGTALLCASGIAGWLGVAVIPVAGIILLTYIGGLLLYNLYKDDKDVAFLKNNLWSNLDSGEDFPEIQRKLRSEYVDAEKITIGKDGSIALPSPETWQKAFKEVVDYLPVSAAPSVIIGINKKVMYIRIQSWDVIPDDTVQMTFKISAFYRKYEIAFPGEESLCQNIDIDNRFLLRDAINVGAPQYVLFEAYFNMRRIEAAVKELFAGNVLCGSTCTIRVTYGNHEVFAKSLNVNFAGKLWINRTDEAEAKLNEAAQSIQ